jgi:hypothetical protein
VIGASVLSVLEPLLSQFTQADMIRARSICPQESQIVGKRKTEISMSLATLTVLFAIFQMRTKEVPEEATNCHRMPNISEKEIFL